MKYFSEVTGKVYDTVNELKEAETEVTNKINARKIDAEKVDAAYKACVGARVAYEKALSDFCKKHGAYHKTFKAEDTKEEWDSLSKMVNALFG
jgi:hypothetical protein